MIQLNKGSLKHGLKSISCTFKSLKTSKLAQDLKKVYIGDVIARIFGIGTAIFVIRFLNVDDYAKYTAFYGIVMFFPALIGGGINSAVVRFSAEYLSNTRKRPFDLYIMSFFLQVVLFGILGFFVLFLFNDTITKLFFGQKSFQIVLKYGFIGGFGYLIIQAGRSVYQAEEKFNQYIKTLWLRQIIIFLAVAMLTYIGQLHFVKLAQIIISTDIFVAIIVSFHIFRVFDFRKLIPNMKRNSSLIKEFISSMKWLMAYYLTLSLFSRLDVFMLSHFSGIEELANYGVASKYYGIALLLLGSISAVLLPRFSRVDMQDTKKQQEFIIKWLSLSFWVIIPIMIFVIFGKPLFMLINGEKYDKAYYIFIIFSIGIWLSLMFSPLVNVLLSRKNFRYLFMLALGAFLLNFGGNYFLIPFWGGFGAAVVTIFSHNIFLQGFILRKVLKNI